VLLLREPVVCVAAPKHPLAAKSRDSADDVARLARPLFRLRCSQKHQPARLRLAGRAGAAMDIAMETARALAPRSLGSPQQPSPERRLVLRPP
jgi:LysR substrate binding domain